MMCWTPTLVASLRWTHEPDGERIWPGDLAYYVGRYHLDLPRELHQPRRVAGLGSAGLER